MRSDANGLGRANPAGSWAAYPVNEAAPGDGLYHLSGDHLFVGQGLGMEFDLKFLVPSIHLQIKPDA